MQGTCFLNTINLLLTFQIPQKFLPSEKKKLQISSDRINTLTQLTGEFIDKLFEGEETVLLINNLANLTVMNALYHPAATAML